MDLTRSVKRPQPSRVMGRGHLTQPFSHDSSLRRTIITIPEPTRLLKGGQALIAWLRLLQLALEVGPNHVHI